MLIAKRLRPLLPDDSSMEQESPVLASPDVSTASCPTCHAEYTPLLYRFPGVTRSQHNHADSGGIYCSTQPHPVLGAATALGRTLGTVHIDQSMGFIAMIRADAVDLTTLYIHCAVCAKVVTSGAITLAPHHVQPVFTCDSCLQSALRAHHTLTGWAFRATPTDLRWMRSAASPPLPRSNSREPRQLEQMF